MNAYMIFSRLAGSDYCAALVFAHSAREARNVGWYGIGSDITDDFLDLASRRLRNKQWLFEEADGLKLANDIPHCIDSPKSCISCECWGQSPIGTDGLCDECRGEQDLELRLEAATKGVEK